MDEVGGPPGGEQPHPLRLEVGEHLRQALRSELVGEVEGRTCVIVDDMIDTGGTIVQAANALKENGAERIIVAATHPILSGPAVQRLRDSPISEVVVTDTLPLGEEHLFPQLTVLPIAPLLARAIREVFDDGSVTSLFDAIGTVTVHGGKVTITVGAERQIFDHPSGKDVDAQMVVDLRHMLTAAGYTPS